jgi:hypothetical protein
MAIGPVAFQHRPHPIDRNGISVTVNWCQAVNPMINGRNDHRHGGAYQKG